MRKLTTSCNTKIAKVSQSRGVPFCPTTYRAAFPVCLFLTPSKASCHPSSFIETRLTNAESLFVCHSCDSNIKHGVSFVYHCTSRINRGVSFRLSTIVVTAISTVEVLLSATVETAASNAEFLLSANYCCNSSINREVSFVYHCCNSSIKTRKFPSP